jgi:hypothetical protein
MGALSDMGRTELGKRTNWLRPRQAQWLLGSVPSLTQRHCTVNAVVLAQDQIQLHPVTCTDYGGGCSVMNMNSHPEPSAANDAHWLASRSAKPQKSRWSTSVQPGNHSLWLFYSSKDMVLALLMAGDGTQYTLFF